MQHGPSFEEEINQPFLEPEGSLPRTQELATGPHSEPDESMHQK
jgi:hypothetical protein